MYFCSAYSNFYTFCWSSSIELFRENNLNSLIIYNLNFFSYRQNIFSQLNSSFVFVFCKGVSIYILHIYNFQLTLTRNFHIVSRQGDNYFITFTVKINCCCRRESNSIKFVVCCCKSRSIYIIGESQCKLTRNGSFCCCNNFKCSTCVTTGSYCYVKRHFACFVIGGINYFIGRNGYLVRSSFKNIVFQKFRLCYLKLQVMIFSCVKITILVYIITH